MKLELESAAFFLVHILQSSRHLLYKSELKKFYHSFKNIMQKKIRNLWFPENPLKGSNFRCIRINDKIDPVIEESCKASCIPTSLFRMVFPLGLILWINPKEVSYRIGENGKICVIYKENEWVPFIKNSSLYF